jgi:hypothetical protein
MQITSGRWIGSEEILTSNLVASINQFDYAPGSGFKLKLLLRQMGEEVRHDDRCVGRVHGPGSWAGFMGNSLIAGAAAVKS